MHGALCYNRACACDLLVAPCLGAASIAMHRFIVGFSHQNSYPQTVSHLVLKMTVPVMVSVLRRVQNIYCVCRRLCRRASTGRSVVVPSVVPSGLDSYGSLRDALERFESLLEATGTLWDALGAF